MDDDDFRQRLRKVLEQPIAPAQIVVALIERIEQAVDRVRKLGGLRRPTDASRETSSVSSLSRVMRARNFRRDAHR